jgi:hypothetical protein
MSILKKLAKVLFIVAITSVIARYVIVFNDSRLSGERAPYIQMLTPDSVVIRWITTQNQLGIIRFSDDHQYLSQIKLEASSTKNHTIKLSNLKPATKYYYQTGEVGSSQKVDTLHQWFYTPPLVITPTRVWVIGDSGMAGETLNQVRDAANDWMRQQPRLSTTEEASIKPGLIDIWIALGDMAYPSGTNDEYQAGLFDVFGHLLANTAIWPVYGHRDARRWTYFSLFDLPENAEAGGIASHTENYYSMDYSNIHLVMLDSQSSDRSVASDMVNWLKRDLASNKKTWVIVAFHHPPYAQDGHENSQQMRENVLPVLEAAGVDLVLSSYNHNYQRSFLLDCAYQSSDKFSSENIVSDGVDGKNQHYLKPLQKTPHQGTIYVVAGSASMVDDNEVNNPLLYTALAEAGSMVIDIDKDKLIARFINDKGEVRDEFSITKKADYKGTQQLCER